ncbi:m protein repeat protein [Colletotrichum karsti]|uniref:M protein repeat protein n=1 Tax=Colletotrichum karsti TaxID=1095194 RepID=A0A9P6HWZ5_9PEZI|nr:m protein repeat protein [Colletotrichum karsti]KAF9869826.1 m protein repeat protein [Colletotrichum karsti]
MAAPAKSSRWGSFLQQAVAGVEARLDNILAEGENGPGQQQTQAPDRPDTPAKEQSQVGPSRSSTSSRTNDRLQERLAKAMAAKNSQSSDARSARPSADGDRPGAVSPQNEPSAAFVSISTAGSASAPSVPALGLDVLSGDTTQNISQPTTASVQHSEETPRSPITTPKEINSESAKTVSTSSTVPPPRLYLPESSTTEALGKPAHDCNRCTELQVRVEALEAGYEQAAKDQQEEIHRHVEQFEALQAKVQFLAKEATDAARKSAVAAPAGSDERKLAERDEKIALLMEEGRYLAATEQKHRSIIKKLRSQVAGDEKVVGDLRGRLEKALADMETLRTKATRVEELEQLNQELQIRSNGMLDELNALRADAATDKSTIQKLREDLRKATDQANFAVAQANEEALAAAKRRTKDLEDSVAALQLEKTFVADRAKASTAEAEDKAARAAERSRLKEIELMAEIQAMEGKLEAMRALAEEASSGAVGDSQAKLLRQVETLQTQHAIATENWQGIEASLLARLGNLERERDDALRRESDMRRKARETATKCKRQDEELQELSSRFPSYQRDIETYKSRVDTLQKRAEEAESALAQARSDLEKQQMPTRLALAVRTNAYFQQRPSSAARRLWPREGPQNFNPDKWDGRLPGWIVSREKVVKPASIKTIDFTWRP